MLSKSVRYSSRSRQLIIVATDLQLISCARSLSGGAVIKRRQPPRSKLVIKPCEYGSIFKVQVHSESILLVLRWILIELIKIRAKVALPKVSFSKRNRKKDQTVAAGLIRRLSKPQWVIPLSFRISRLHRHLTRILVTKMVAGGV